MAQRPSSQVYPVGQSVQASPALYISEPEHQTGRLQVTTAGFYLLFFTDKVSTDSIVADDQSLIEANSLKLKWVFC